MKYNTALCCLDGELWCLYLARSLSLLRCWKKEGSQISCSSWHTCLQDFPGGANFTCMALRGGHITWPWQKSYRQTEFEQGRTFTDRACILYMTVTDMSSLMSSCVFSDEVEWHTFSRKPCISTNTQSKVPGSQWMRWHAVTSPHTWTHTADTAQSETKYEEKHQKWLCVWVCTCSDIMLGPLLLSDKYDLTSSFEVLKNY